MGEKAGDAAALGVGDQDDSQAVARVVGLDNIQYHSEHPYQHGVVATIVAGSGICAFCLQEKLGRLVSSSNSSPFFPLGGHPPLSASPSSFLSVAEAPPPLHSSTASRKLTPFHRKKISSSSSSSSSSASMAMSASMAGGGLKRSKSVALMPEEQFPSSASSVTAESPRNKSFKLFLYLSSSDSYAHQTASSASYNNWGGAARRKSVSAAWVSWVRPIRTNGPQGHLVLEAMDWPVIDA